MAPAQIEFAEDADRLVRVPLVSHLRDHFLLQRHLTHRAQLRDRVRQRLLTVDMLAGIERSHHRDVVAVIWCRHQHRIQIVRLLIEHLPEILIALRPRVELK